MTLIKYTKYNLIYNTAMSYMPIQSCSSLCNQRVLAMIPDGEYIECNSSEAVINCRSVLKILSASDGR